MKKASIVAACLLAALGIYIGLSFTIAIVPNVVGESTEVAYYILEKRHLTVEYTEEYSDTVPKGTVISQETKAGTVVRRGGNISVVLSLGEQMCRLPDLTDATREEAEATLHELGFAVHVTEAFSDTLARGLVVYRSAEANTLAKVGSTIELTVSLGRDLVLVPSVCGMTLDEATDTLKQNDLDAEYEHAFSDTVEKGLVISQQKESGTSVLRGSTVTLTVSKGVDLVTVPDVSNKTMKYATALLEEHGLNAEYKLTYSDTVAENTIISQGSDAGTQVKRGSFVVLYVSGGVAPAEVPNLQNKTLAEAEETLTALSLHITAEEEFSPTVEKGKIIGQSIAAGTKVEKGSTVHVFVSKGPDLTTVPDVLGKSASEASKELTAAGFFVVRDIQCSDNVPEGRVLSQSAAPQSLFPRDATITVTVSAGVANTRGTSNSNGRDFGSVAAQGDWIYYVGDNFRLYKVRSDGSEKQLLTSTAVTYINVVGEWVYFSNLYDNYRLYKIKLNGTEETKVSSDSCFTFYVIDDWVYYRTDFTASYIYKMRIDGTQKTKLVLDQCVYMNIEGAWLYYAAADTYSIYRVSIHGGEKYLVNPNFIGYSLVVEDGVAYCLPTQISSNLLRVNIDGTQLYDYPKEENTQILNFCISDDWIYFVKAKFSTSSYETFICKMKTDGSEETELCKITLPNINMYLNVVGNWIYYPDASDHNRINRVKTDGSVMEKFS